MTKRLQIIYSAIPECEVFADIGCDHGYITKYVLDNSKCKRAIISDISAKCLQKAKDLLQSEIKAGLVSAVVSNGFEKLDRADCALIAGMGGMEIISILKNAPYLPQSLVLQPMKNIPELRVFLLELGYAFVSDRVFFAEDKFYNLLVLKKGEDSLSEQEIKFGRTNLTEQGQDFKDMIKKSIADYIKIANVIEDDNPKKAHIMSVIKEMEQYV